MTKKHLLLFWQWRLKMWLKGLRVGTRVRVFNSDKNFFINGTIEFINGDSITKKNYCFYFWIKWDEPTEGTNNRFFTKGSYNEKEIKRMMFRYKIYEKHLMDGL